MTRIVVSLVGATAAALLALWYAATRGVIAW